MNEELDRLFAEIVSIEGEIERRLATHRDQFKYSIVKGRALFDKDVAKGQRQRRTGAWRYLVRSELRHVALAPVIYAMLIPFGLLDLSLSFYQRICFAAWGIARVTRRDYVVIDRHRLGYLNIIEKLNCVYCGYGNGVIAYAREITSRTEQYWCPIRHATQIRGAHSRYRDFVDYGDAAGYTARLAELRAKLR